MKEELDVDYDNYVIPSYCSPRSALKALQVEKEIGLLLPCNVTVYEGSGDCVRFSDHILQLQ